MREAAELLRTARLVWVASHTSPDGDSVGSVLGLGHVLREMGRQVILAVPEPPPRHFSFLPGLAELAHLPPSGKEDLLVVLDSTDPARLGDLCRPAVFNQLPVLNIDHHVTNEAFGTVNLVDPRASSTAELVLGLLEELGAPLTAEAATCLLFGLVADTQGFRTSSTTPQSLACAARLLQAGADLAEINRSLFLSASLVALRLQGEILAGARLEGGIVWSLVTPELLQRHGASEEDVAGVVSLLAQATEAQAAVLFKEWQPGVTEVSIRSKPGVDISEAALRLDGGGHPQAAGATLYGPGEEVRQRVLAELHRSLRAQAPLPKVAAGPS